MRIEFVNGGLVLHPKYWEYKFLNWRLNTNDHVADALADKGFDWDVTIAVVDAMTASVIHHHKIRIIDQWDQKIIEEVVDPTYWLAQVYNAHVNDRIKWPMSRARKMTYRGMKIYSDVTKALTTLNQSAKLDAEDGDQDAS